MLSRFLIATALPVIAVLGGYLMGPTSDVQPKEKQAQTNRDIGPDESSKGGADEAYPVALNIAGIEDTGLSEVVKASLSVGNSSLRSARVAYSVSHANDKGLPIGTRRNDSFQSKRLKKLLIRCCAHPMAYQTATMS